MRYLVQWDLCSLETLRPYLASFGMLQPQSLNHVDPLDSVSITCRDASLQNFLSHVVIIAYDNSFFLWCGCRLMFGALGSTSGNNFYMGMQNGSKLSLI